MSYIPSFAYTRIMDYIGDEEITQLSSLVESDIDIIKRIREVLPSYDITSDLLRILNKVEKYSLTIGSDAYLLYNYIINMDIAEFTVEIDTAQSIYIHIYTYDEIDIIALREIFPSIKIERYEPNHRDHYELEASLHVENTQLFIDYICDIAIYHEHEILNESQTYVTISLRQE